MPRAEPRAVYDNGEYVEEEEEVVERWWTRVWRDNKGAVLILLAQVAGSSMDAIVRFMQQGEHAMHPFQIIFARMGTTFVLSTAYMAWKGVPDFFLGKKGVRGWLALRALFGYFGLICLYYSVHYLPLAEATVFRFLVPIVTAWACSVFLGQVFGRKELIAGLVALVGVVIIAHPAALFGNAGDGVASSMGAGAADDVSPSQRLLAVVVSILGVAGASGAYTVIRVIGDRAHPLISVNYFAMLATAGSTLGLLLVPGIGFTMPQGALQWALLLVLGVLGFVLQILLTVGLRLDKSSKATSMMYSAVIFALTFDWVIWGVLPDGFGIFGGVIVIASTFWSALQKTKPVSKKDRKEAAADEETALLGPQTDGIEEVTRRSSIAGQ